VGIVLADFTVASAAARVDELTPPPAVAAVDAPAVPPAVDALDDAVGDELELAAELQAASAKTAAAKPAPANLLDLTSSPVICRDLRLVNQRVEI
jgi:hypothetical protein